MGGNHGRQSSLDELKHSMGEINFGFRAFHPHSLPEFHGGLIGGIPFNNLSAIAPIGTNNTSRVLDGSDNQQNRGGIARISSPSLDYKEAFGVAGKGFPPINQHQYLPRNSTTTLHRPQGSQIWQSSAAFANSIPATTQLRGPASRPSNIMATFVPLPHHHVGSAPALNPSLWERGITYSGQFLERRCFHPGSLGNMGFSGGSQMHGIAPHNMHSLNFMEPSISSADVGNLSQQRTHMLHGRTSLTSAFAASEVHGERIRNRRSDVTANQADNKKQFELDIDRIIRGEDLRATLMIKRIPNKYTSKMLVVTIDEQHKGSYDFIYLPIDFKNKCNVGYAFINLTHPKHIVPFYQSFNGKKWEKFNSEKVASLAYARIQGKAAPIAHFQNSSLMNEDERCHPILFHSDGPNAGDQEPFPIGTHTRQRPGRSRSTINEDLKQRSPSDNGDDLSNGTGSSSSSIQDS